MHYISIYDNGLDSPKVAFHVSMEEMIDHCSNTNYIPYTLSKIDLERFEQRLIKRRKIIMLSLVIGGLISLVLGCSL